MVSQACQCHISDSTGACPSKYHRHITAHVTSISLPELRHTTAFATGMSLAGWAHIDPNVTVEVRPNVTADVRQSVCGNATAVVP